jgi:hypothetical protein
VSTRRAREESREEHCCFPEIRKNLTNVTHAWHGGLPAGRAPPPAALAPTAPAAAKPTEPAAANPAPNQAAKPQAKEPFKLEFMMPWVLPTEYAYFLVADAKGCCQDEGIQIDLNEGSGSGNTVKVVGAGTVPGGNSGSSRKGR